MFGLGLFVGASTLGCDGEESSSAFGNASGAGSPSPEGSGGIGEEGGGGDQGGPPLDPDDGGGEPPPTPEQEDEADFRVPQASGPYVYSASETTDSVAVIDSGTLTIEVVGVGRGPTVIAPVFTDDERAGAVVVLDQRSDDLALLHTAPGGDTTVSIHDVTSSANALAVSPDRRYVFVHVDVDGAEEIGSGSDQEVTVFDVVSGETHLMTVGAHPRAIEFSPDATRAFIVTADGVNVVPLGGMGIEGKPDIVPVSNDPGIDPRQLEIFVAATYGVAITRIEGQPTIVATNLLTGARQVLTLSGIPTDLDLSPTGDFALLAVPSVTEGSRLLELRLPLQADSAFVEHLVPGEYLGLAQLSPDGNAGIFYTSQNPPRPVPDAEESTDGDATGGESMQAGLPSDVDPRFRVTLGHRTEAGWSTDVTLFIDRVVDSVGIAPDGRNAMLIHAMDPAATVPYAYTLVDLTKEFPVKKTQTLEAPPEPILFTPDGARAVVLLRDDRTDVRRVEQIDLESFIVANLQLGSPPEGVGFVASTAKVFVSQDHPTGRITFIEAGGSIQTVTGFRINDAVKD